MSFYDNTMKLKTFSEKTPYRRPEVHAYTLSLKRSILQDSQESIVNRGENEQSADEYYPGF